MIRCRYQLAGHDSSLFYAAFTGAAAWPIFAAKRYFGMMNQIRATNRFNPAVIMNTMS